MTATNLEELAICRRRGHHTRISDAGWLQCQACGMWVRGRRTIEEREDAPRTGTGSELLTKRHLAQLDREIAHREKP